MIKKLRLKLTAVSMVSLLIVLTVIIGAVNIFNYTSLISEADSTLNLLSENNGSFPKEPKPDGGFNKGFKGKSPELPYESRYFSVVVGNNGQAVSSDTGKIAAINSQTAMDYAEEIVAKNRQKGFMGKYRFTVCTDSDTLATRVIFLDCGRSLDSFYSTLVISVCVSVLGMICVLALMILLSRRIVKPIAESYEKQKQFITDAGHEIKTPITIIDADASVLEMDIKDNEWLTDIKNQTRRLAELTNDLIFLSRMEEGQKALQIIDFPLSDITAETANSFDKLAKAKGKTLSLEIEPMISINGDEKSLRQLISILLDNALKYSPDGSKIDLLLQKQGKSVVLQVSNPAADISPEDAQRMFDRFYRTDKSHNSKTGGYGIGLAIAKAVAQAHKGKISAEIKNDVMKISVTLPVT